MIKAVIFDMYETLITENKGYKFVGSEISKELGVDKKSFLHIWRNLERERSIGKISFEEVIRHIMNQLGCTDEERYQNVIRTRYITKRDCFHHLHPDLLSTLDTLRERNIKIGLISNCFSEEVTVIRESCLFSYFDTPILSYEVGLMKPQPEIYRLCLDGLGTLPEECIYLGDGGCHELEGAKACGMLALQAGWYFDDYFHELKKIEFRTLSSPNEILDYCKEAEEL